MPSPHRDLVEFWVTTIRREVNGADTWKFHREEPIYHPADDRHCAVWWDGDEPTDQGTTGWAEFADRIGVRYWEPAPEQALARVDEAAALAIEGYMDAVRAAVFANRTDATGSYESNYRGSMKFVGRDGDRVVRGFELAIVCRRPIGYS